MCSERVRTSDLYVHVALQLHREMRAEMAEKLQPVLNQALSGLDAGKTQILFEKVGMLSLTIAATEHTVVTETWYTLADICRIYCHRCGAAGVKATDHTCSK